MIDRKQLLDFLKLAKKVNADRVIMSVQNNTLSIAADADNKVALSASWKVSGQDDVQPVQCYLSDLKDAVNTMQDTFDLALTDLTTCSGTLVLVGYFSTSVHVTLNKLATLASVQDIMNKEQQAWKEHTIIGLKSAIEAIGFIAKKSNSIDQMYDKFLIEPDKIVLTDTVRLAIADIVHDASTFALPALLTKALASAMTDSMTFFLSPYKIVLVLDNGIHVIMPVLDEKFPKYDTIMPKSHTWTGKASIKQALATFSAAKKATKQVKHVASLHLNGSIEVEALEYFSGKVDAETNGDVVDIKLNTAFVADFLKANKKANTVRIGASNINQPTIWTTDTNILYLLMPINA